MSKFEAERPQTKENPEPTITGEHLRVLVVPNTVFFPPYLDERQSAWDVGSEPRAWVSDVDAHIEYLDQRLLTSPSAWRRRMYLHMPMWLVQVLEVYRVGRTYDAVFLWSVANVTLLLGLILRLTGRRMVIVALLTRVSERRKAWLLKRVHGQLAKIILPPASQRDFAVRTLGVPDGKLVALPWTLDSEFWRPRDPETARDMICAAGGEMRDYPTLVRAMAGLDISCHIAGVYNTSRADWWNVGDDQRRQHDGLPPNVSFGTMSAAELRDLYGRSRFVVVPLQRTDSDNGITCMNEAWSMGCPVIVSAVEGQRDAFVDGQEGLWVPQGDVGALREAIVRLWGDPARAAAMGANGRRLVERGRDHRVFSEGIGQVLAEAATRDCA